ncbi:HlyU family transcriptional regulator [Oceanisphaera pacifica]|uniref:Transcriptional regulator n=1 Tax=Oceanisphaera pacifica TaxID=2818389 RepID=A0ABS3NFE3_9GAMM|nr:HlyU family transcriptional regulator [Oceanisphaera pacifica]MBO1519001.1 transcriptional regulator [Oceanisphaera pacifica]
MFNWFKRLAQPKVDNPAQFEPESYQGFTIYPEPLAEHGQFRLHGRITQQHNGEQQEYRLIRSDLLPSAELAASLMIDKAKRVIDENGARLFD